MGGLFAILVVVAIVGCVGWNHRNAAVALRGVEFPRREPPEVVTRAIARACRPWSRAALRARIGGLAVEPYGRTSFRTLTATGDEGTIEVLPDRHGSRVRAYAITLRVGPQAHYKLAGIAPGAVRLKRFQAGLERRLRTQLGP